MPNLNFEKNLIKKLNNNEFDYCVFSDINVNSDKYIEEYVKYTYDLDDSSVKLFEKIYKISDIETIIKYPIADILVGYKSENIEPINMSLILNNKSYSIELTHNKFVPAFDNKFYLPIITLQNTDIIVIKQDFRNIKLIR
jgi:hypothetical protein